MKKTDIGIFMLFLVVILLLATLIIYTIKQPFLTGRVIEPINNYTYTKAICDKNNCQDYEIACNDNETISITPISGRVIFSDDWQDPRDPEEIEKLCGRQ